MNKRIKWGIIILIGAGLAGLGIYQFTPHENEELTAADALPKENKQRTLKVNAQVIKPHLLTDEILVTGRLVPDEEVSLSFETSGKITDIFHRRHIGKTRRITCQSKRPAVTGSVKTSGSTNTFSRRPCVPPKRPAKTRCGQ